MKNMYLSDESVRLQIWSLCLAVTNLLASSKVKKSTKQHPLDVLYLRLLMLLCFLVELLFCLNINGAGLMEEKWKKTQKTNCCSLNLVMQVWMLLNRYYLPVPTPAEGYCCGHVFLMQEDEQAISACYLNRGVRQNGIGYSFNYRLRDFSEGKPRLS